MDKPEYLAHVPESRRPGLLVANAGKPLAELQGDTKVILDRIRNGERAVDVAASLGVSHQALYAFLLKNSAEEWQALSAGRSLARIERAEIDLDEAEDQIAISKARESARIAQWSLERSARRLYGDSKGEIGGVTVQVLIQRDGETVIETERS